MEQSFETREAVFRATAGGGGDLLPPDEGWQHVDDGEMGSNIRVTGFNLTEATAEQMYARGGEQAADGIVCKIKDINPDFKSEEWMHIMWMDKQICDKTKNCERGLDEPEGCQQPVGEGLIWFH